MDEILEEIKKERIYQDNKWGTAIDDKNTINDWISFIARYACRAGQRANTSTERREDLIKVAALAIAAIQAFDRNKGFPPRHYD